MKFIHFRLSALQRLSVINGLCDLTAVMLWTQKCHSKLKVHAETVRHPHSNLDMSVFYPRFSFTGNAPTIDVLLFYFFIFEIRVLHLSGYLPYARC